MNSTWFFIPILLFVIWGFIDILYVTIRFGVGPMPSTKKAIQKAATLVESHQDIIYDIGGGFGRPARYFAQIFPQKKIILIEISSFSCFIAKLYCRKITNIEIQRVNLLHYNFRDNAFIYAYLYPSLMQNLFKRLKDWKGRVASYTFSFRNKKEHHICELSKSHSDKLYIYDFRKSS